MWADPCLQDRLRGWWMTVTWWKLQPLRALSRCLEVIYGHKNLPFMLKAPSTVLQPPRLSEQGESSSIPLPTWAGPVFPPARTSKPSWAVLRSSTLGRGMVAVGGGLGGGQQHCVSAGCDQQITCGRRGSLGPHPDLGVLARHGVSWSISFLQAECGGCRKSEIALLGVQPAHAGGWPHPVR